MTFNNISASNLNNQINRANAENDAAFAKRIHDKEIREIMERESKKEYLK